jgi:Putative adhesin
MRAVIVIASAIALSACQGALGGLTARASDEWTRMYQLAAGGELQVVNSNGKLEVEGVDGDVVEVRAERIARGATEAAARELLPRIEIHEDVRPDRVAIETRRPSGILIGVSFEVQYRVRVPKTALVRLRTVNGELMVTALRGRLVATTTNGAVTGRDLSGGVEARTTNGRVTIDLGSIGADPIELRTVNGELQLTLPRAARANLSATCTNGAIDVSGVALELMGEQSRRRVRGRMNGGGTPVELTTTNGAIRVAVR